MRDENKTKFLMVRFVHVSFIISTLIFTGLIEYLKMKPESMPFAEPVLGVKGYIVMQSVLTGFAVVLLLFAYGLRRAVATLNPGIFLNIAKAIAKNSRKRQGSTYGIYIIIGAVCESASIFGIVLFMASGGQRLAVYPFIIASLVSLAVFFPANNDGDNLEKIDDDIIADS